MFFSTYRKDRFVAKGFLKAQLDSYRAIGENFIARPWSGIHTFIPLDVRVLIVTAPSVYFIHYWQVERVAHKKYLDGAVVKRWGPTVEDVREKLSPAEQLHVRSWASFEKRHGITIPKSMANRPPGCDLPNFHDVYGKDAVSHFGHH